MKLFKDVKVIGVNIDTAVYLRRDPNIKRGHRDWVMSRGELMDFARCPFKWIEGVPREDTAATRWGSLLDCLILTPEKFTKQFVIRPATYKAKAMKCPSCGSITDSKKCAACKCEREEVEVEKDWNENSTVCSGWTAEQVKAGFAIAKQDDYDQAIKALEIGRASCRERV